MNILSKSNKAVVAKKSFQAKVVLSRSPKRLASCPSPVETFVKQERNYSSAVELFSGAWIPTLMESYQPSRLSHEVDTAPRKVPKLEPIDILFGRGNTINQHSGNALMRQIANMNKEEYKMLYKERKHMAADALAGFMEKCGGRFLEVDPTNPKSHPTYQTVDYRRVVEKWMQTLREIPVEEKRQRRFVAEKSKDRLAAAEGLVRFQQRLPKTPRKVQKAQSTNPEIKLARTTNCVNKKPKYKNRENRGAESTVGCSKRIVSVVGTAGIHYKETKNSRQLSLKKCIPIRTLPLQGHAIVGDGRRMAGPLPSPESSSRRLP